jgi:spectinomycin phosphotransferase
VQDEPAEISAEALAALLRDRWGFPVTGLEYAPVGFGDHHWTAAGLDGQRWFITVKDPAMYDPDPAGAAAIAEDMAATMRAATELAAAGLEFVLAPLPTLGGTVVEWLAPHYLVAAFPHLDADGGDWGETYSPQDRAAVIGLLARLHQVPPDAALPASTVLPARTVLPVRDVAVPHREFLDGVAGGAALDWDSGPHAAAARDLAEGNRPALGRGLRRFDELAAELAADPPPVVITHGEPHPGNVLRDGGRLLLIDWDTAGLAWPERDLWSITQAGTDDAARYEAATGYRPDARAIEMYALLWALTDIGDFLRKFSGPHIDSPDSDTAWEGLIGSFGDLMR